MHIILYSENHFQRVGKAIPGDETYPRSCGKQFRVAKPIPKVVECWRKMRNHSAEMKSLIAKCAACFFSEKSNFQPGIGLFIFEKSNRKLRRILFFEKSNFQTEIRLRKFAEWFRILRRLSHRGTAVAFCAAWFFVGQQSHFALHIPR